MNPPITQQNIPKGWQQVKLGSFLDAEKGRQPKKLSSERHDGYLPYLTIKGITGDEVQYARAEDGILAREGDLLVIADGSRSGYLFSGKDGLVSSTFLRIRPKDDRVLDSAYLYQLFHALKFTESRFRKGGAIPHFDFKQLNELQITLPTIPEQKRIAEILGAVDEEIQKTDEIITATEKLRRGLMQQLFTRGIGHTKFKKTKIGEIPEEWEESNLGSQIKALEAGVSVNGEDRLIKNGEVGVLKTSAVTFGVFDSLQHKAVEDRDLKRVSIPVRGNRIIISRMNTAALVGANAYVPNDIPNLFLPDRLWLAEPNDESKVSMLWLSYILGFLWRRGQFSKLASGTSASMKNLSKEKVLDVRIAFPAIEEQGKIASILSAVDEKIEINQKIKAKLRLLKKGLMQDLLSGKKRVTV